MKGIKGLWKGVEEAVEDKRKAVKIRKNLGKGKKDHRKVF